LEPNGTSTRTRRHILLVDDEIQLLRNLQLLLNEAGNDADAATGGRDACEKVRERRYDAVVTDLRMPDVDGFAVLDCARAAWPDVPLVVMTAYSELLGDLDEHAAGPRPKVLMKPFDVGELVGLVAPESAE